MWSENVIAPQPEASSRSFVGCYMRRVPVLGPPTPLRGPLVNESGVIKNNIPMYISATPGQCSITSHQSHRLLLLVMMNPIGDRMNCVRVQHSS